MRTAIGHNISWRPGGQPGIRCCTSFWICSSNLHHPFTSSRFCCLIVQIAFSAATGSSATPKGLTDDTPRTTAARQFVTADSEFPPLPKPPFKVARSSEWDDRPAVALADSASGSASKSPATRAQLDQLFDTLSSKHNIRTAQCWSLSKYREFATPIYDHTSEAVGCCYFTVSAFIDHVICHMMVA